MVVFEKQKEFSSKFGGVDSVERRDIMADFPEFSVGSVPLKVVSKVLNMKPDTIRDKMEDETLDLGIIYKARKKRGKRAYRNTYISPKKLYELTGYVWKGEKEAIETKKE